MLASPATPARRPAAIRPLHGPTGIFAKGLRDSRRAVLLAGIGIGLTVVAIGASTTAYYPTVASRLQSAQANQSMPAFAALFGQPLGLERLGGQVYWNDGWFVTMLLGLWSILALSSTLAGEADSGSLEMLAAVPLSRRRIALEKLAVHLVGMALVVLIASSFTWLTGVAYSVLPGDGIAFTDALAELAGWALLSLVGGGIAFALAPILGRSLSAGVAAACFFGAFVVNAYSGLVPAFDSIRPISWFSWTTRQHPLAGSWDPLSLVPLTGLVVVVLAAGVLVFERRDLGSEMRVRRPRLPGRKLLLRSPAGLTFLRSRGTAIAWGLALGLALGAIALGSAGMAASTAADPGSAAFVQQVFGEAEWTSSRGLLQLSLAWFGYLVLALVAAVLVGRLASDETQRRLDVILSTPSSRARWLVGGAVGTYGCIALLTFLVGVMAATGTAGVGGDVVLPFLGVWVGGLYAAALAGVGLAVLGFGRIGLAAVVPGALAIGMYLWDGMASIFHMPAEVAELSLTHHLGRPMTGAFDWPGIAILLILAAGGPAVGAWGMRRRDISR